MKIVVPSYKRKDIFYSKIFRLLKWVNIEKILYIRREEKDDYWIPEWWSVVLLDWCSSFSDTVSKIFEKFSEWEQIVLIDDDVSAITKLSLDWAKLEKIENEKIDKFFEKTFLIMDRYGFKYGWVYPISNSFFMAHSTSFSSFVRSTLSFHIVNDKCKRDTNITDMCDYDMTLQNMEHFGWALRLNYYAVVSNYATYKWGCQTYRSSEVRVENIAKLQKKRPWKIKINPKRENEILFA